MFKEPTLKINIYHLPGFHSQPLTGKYVTTSATKHINRNKRKKIRKRNTISEMLYEKYAILHSEESPKVTQGRVLLNGLL